MASTKIFRIHNHLSRAVNYAINPEKTDDGRWTGFYNCRADQAHINMINTQKRFNQWNARQDSVQGYHIIQSFKPYEVTAEIAEKIAQEFCERYLSDTYEVAYGIHTDKDHMHIHYVFNAVSFVSGKRFHDSVRQYKEYIRPLSDELCAKHGLSVIQNQSKEQTLHYGEWKLKQSGQPTWKDLIKHDIDTLLLEAISFHDFIGLMEKAGYEVKQNKHIAFRPYGKERFVRGYKLGTGYDKESLRNRLDDSFEQDNQPYAKIYKQWRPKTLSYPCKGKRQKLKGLQAHYFRFLYAMHKVKSYVPEQASDANLRKELEKLETHKRIYNFLIQNEIQTPQDLTHFTEKQQAMLTALEAEKKGLSPTHKQQQAFRNLALLKKMQDGYDMYLAGNPIMQDEFNRYQTASENLKKLGYDSPEKVELLLKEQRKLYQARSENKDAIHDCKCLLKLCGSTAVMVQKLQTEYQEFIQPPPQREVKTHEHGR